MHFTKPGKVIEAIKNCLAYDLEHSPGVYTSKGSIPYLVTEEDKLNMEALLVYITSDKGLQ